MPKAPPLRVADFTPLVLEACPDFRDRLAQSKAWRAAEGTAANPYNDAGVFATFVVAHARDGRTASFPAVFTLIERFLTEGDAELSRVVRTGLLGLRLAAIRDVGDPELLRPWLGPATLTLWEDVTTCQRELDAHRATRNQEPQGDRDER